MKYFTFARESNKFDDILKDATIKKAIRTKILFRNHLIIGIDLGQGQTESYITLKYGEDLINDLIKDFSPIPNVDYVPKRN
jgi:hypothetical protein